MTDINQNYCLNCEESFVEGSKFCFACGQSKRASILSVKELWNNFWTTIFNVDNSFFRTLRLIPRPDRLTQLYVAGKRKKHINPIRLFLISLVFFVAAAITVIGDFGDSSFLKNINRDYYSSLMLERFEEEMDLRVVDSAEYERMQSIKDTVFEGVSCVDVDTIFNGMRIVDFDGFKYLTKKDFSELSEEEIYEKYGIDGFWDRLKQRQYIRINKDPNSSNKFLFNNAMWGLIPSILVLCLFLKLLYRNHKIPYLEHLIFVVNVHSFFFLFWMVSMLILRYFIDDRYGIQALMPIALAAMIFYVFIMMKIYYREGILRSLVKFIFAFFVYGFFSLLFVVLSIVISGFIF